MRFDTFIASFSVSMVLKPVISGTVVVVEFYKCFSLAPRSEEVVVELYRAKDTFCSLAPWSRAWEVLSKNIATL
jgi:hypothetical protein